jgi:hypothetical protein
MSRSARGHFCVAILYLIVAAVTTYPLVFRLTTHLPGRGTDMWVFPWNAWWLSRALWAGESPFFTRYLYFPEGASLAFHSFVLTASGWAPLLLGWLSPLTFYNLFVLIALFGSALSAYALAFHQTRSIPASWLAGLIYGFAPHRLGQAHGHLSSAFGVWLPLMLLAGLVLVGNTSFRRRLWASLAAGAFCLLGILTREAPSIAGFYLLVLLFATRAWTSNGLSWRAAAGWAVAVGGWTLLLGSPYFTLWLDEGGIPNPPRFGASKLAAGISLEKLLAPPRGSLLWQLWQHQLQPRSSLFLGYVLIGMLAWGWRRMRGDVMWRFWFGGALFLLVVSLGPSLVIADHTTEVPLPYRYLPFINMVRSSRRFLLPAMLCGGLAVALLWTRVVQGRTRARTLVATAAVSAIVLIEYIGLPFATTRPRVSPFYQQLAGSKERFGIVEIPSDSRAHDKAYMFYQTLHGKPIHAGHISRIPERTFRFVRSVPLLNALAREGRVPRDGEVINLSRDLATLRDHNFRYIIFHKRFLEPRFRPLSRAEWQVLRAISSGIGPPSYEDDLLVAFDLRRLPENAPRR